ncbi:sulfite exporter TauE/SafE family protein [bacterium]|nr:MAG: sulfite exporter TauE/SafE family protein [bacterium]
MPTPHLLLTDSLLLLVAIFAGALNSVAGGGSFLSFPALLFTGLPPIMANATNNAAMWVGTASSAGGYREEVAKSRRYLVAVAIVSAVGGIAGAIILLRTPSSLFTKLIPFLLLVATLLFIAGPLLPRYAGKPKLSHHDVDRPSPRAIIGQLAVGIYGGYFGAGMGFVMLAMLVLEGFENIHDMNGIKTFLSAIINGVALIPFIIARAIAWPEAIVMSLGAMLGGYLGARVARRLPSQAVRRGVIVIACVLTAYFFYKTFA